MNRLRQLDAVVLVDADKRVTRPRRCTVAALVRRQEPDHRCEFLGMLRRGRSRSRPLRRSPEFTTYSNEAKLFSERSNT